MALVDWSPLLDKIGGKVNFTTFSESFSCSELYDIVLASLHVAEAHYIDVSWKGRYKCFKITLFIDPLTIDDLDNEIDIRYCTNAKDVYPLVEQVIESFINRNVD